MDAKGSFVEGGVKISHLLLEGAHCYKVDVVSIHTQSGGGPAFARKGDTLTSINGTNLASIAPQELTRLLTNGNPKLTVHQAARQPPKACPPGKDAFLPFKKESAVLCFSMEMRREEDLGQGGSGEGVGPADQEHGGEEGEGRGLLVVKLTNVSISVVRGRGCQEGCSDLSCHGAACALNEVVLVAKESTVTLGNTGTFKQFTANQGISLENIVSQTYLRSLCVGNRLYASNNPEKMTIYYYKPNFMEEPFRGMPVVLNFTDSESFLKCCKQEGQAILQVEACDKERLKLIQGQDESALAFLFYMKGNSSKERKFESALCPGWFIRVLSQETVTIDSQPACMEDPSLYFVIQQ